MVFGVESLKKNGMLPAIDSLHQLAFAPFRSVNSPALFSAQASL
jgi:hypothetical protein